jgi:hypothetical protein
MDSVRGGIRVEDVLGPFRIGSEPRGAPSSKQMGRILIPLFLFERKVLSRPVFYLSAYIEEHTEEYVECLRGLGRPRGGWNRWFEFFLKAVIEQAEVNRAAARGIKDLYERLKAKVIKLTHSQFAVPLVHVLFERPIISSSELEGRAGLPGKQMIMTLLGKLKDARILTTLREPVGRRPQMLALSELLDLCEGRPVTA